jgi:hypothetical protein
MSVIIETSQRAMELYVSVAAVGLVLYACTAVCRESLVLNLVLKVAGQVPEPQPEPWPAERKAELPTHAQRMSSLFASDKEFADCRVEGRGTCDAGRGAGREAGGCEAAEVRARAERTMNMPRMSVTLEVSQLSGNWLNAVFCRVEGRGTCVARRGAGREAGGCRVAAGKRHAREGPTQGLEEPGHARSAPGTCPTCP